MPFRLLEIIPWDVFIVYWLISAVRLKQVKVEEAPQGRILHILIMVAAVDLMFWGNFAAGILQQRIIPIDLRILYTGVVLTWVGIAFAIWARYTIGANWSGRVTVKVDHQLIQSGPYAFVRHPIYSGLLVANLGAALVIGRWRCWLAMVIFLAEMTRKASKVEGFMMTVFGERYQQYRRQTGFLIPKLWGSRGQGPTMGGSKDQQMSA